MQCNYFFFLIKLVFNNFHFLALTLCFKTLSLVIFHAEFICA